MDEGQRDVIGASAQVVQGGNRLFEIKAHVVCRDVLGHVRWEDDAVVQVALPHGDDVPDIQCDHVEAVYLGPQRDFLPPRSPQEGSP